MAFKFDSTPIIERFSDAVAKEIERQYVEALDRFLDEQRSMALLRMREFLDRIVLRQLTSETSDRYEIQIVIKDELK